jgi:uncharacterized membrane protein (DUF485 family)
MTSLAYEQIRSNSKYWVMVSRRRRLAGSLAGVVLGLFFLFILVVAFAPGLLATPVSSGGATTIAVPLGVGMIILFWLLTGLYVRRARHDFDEMKNQILKEVQK